MPSLLYDPSQSAVSQLLGLLAQNNPAGQPGAPPPAPVAQMSPVTQQAPPPSQINAGQNPGENPQNMLGKVHDFLSSHLTPGAPQGYEGLLSPDEIAKAKPGILSSIFMSPKGSGAHYEHNLQRIIEMKQMASQVQQQKKAIVAREKMVDLFPAPPNESHADRMNRLEAMYGYAIQNGDMEMADKLKGYAAEATLAQKEQKPQPPHTLTTSKGIMEWNEKTGKYEATGYQPPEKADPIQIISAATPNADGTPGQPNFFRVPKDGGPATPIAGITPHPGSSAQNAQNMAAEALLRSSVSEMTNADTFMKSYENDLASGKKSINGLAQFMGGIGNSFTHDDPASRAIQNTALTALNKVNPDLARYIRRGLSFAEGEAGISKRPSDFRTKMAAFLSTASSGAPKEMIADIQGRRSSILNPLHEVLTDHGKGPTPSTPSAMSYEDWKKSKGHN